MARRRLSYKHSSLGDIKLQIGKVVDSHQHNLQALQLHEDLIVTEPNNVDVKYGLAACLDRIGKTVTVHGPSD